MKKTKGRWRRLYKYVCKGCGKKRTAVRYQRVMNEVCRKCQGPKHFDINQKELF